MILYHFVFVFVGLCFCVFPVWRSSFSVCWRAGLVMLNSASFCLSVKLLIFPLNLNEILAGKSNLGCRFYPFITLSMFCHSLLACRVSVERSAGSLLGCIPLYIICCFSLAAFNIFLCISFFLVWYVSWHVSPWVYPIWDSWALWTWVAISLPFKGSFHL